MVGVGSAIDRIEFECLCGYNWIVVVTQSPFDGWVYKIFHVGSHITTCTFDINHAAWQTTEKIMNRIVESMSSASYKYSCEFLPSDRRGVVTIS